ncbi:glutamine amidotransferase family protein [Granulibacter bethesdensis]|nr:glutamine amidotransferase family protein [Granulibacter bethesdensis]
MCGIVGLFLKDKGLQPLLGRMTADMLGTMTDRGPDSAGIAIYGGGSAETVKFSLRAEDGYDFAALAAQMQDALKVKVGVNRHDTHAVFVIPASRADEAAIWLHDVPGVDVFAQGHRIELYKEVGLPRNVAQRFGIGDMTGTHAVGHTRMATESAVTTCGAHPFSTGMDQCLVHNGSLSNHAGLRRMLKREGIRITTENDSEVAAGYLSLRMRQGLSLGDALKSSLNDLDGFFTFVVGTENGFAVLRDPVACKPAVMAETDQYVAFGSEYRALAGLPGIRQARVWEPEPATVYFWEHQ